MTIILDSNVCGCAYMLGYIVGTARLRGRGRGGWCHSGSRVFVIAIMGAFSYKFTIRAVCTIF